MLEALQVPYVFWRELWGFRLAGSMSVVSASLN